jgi:hypothetical protein
VSRPGDTRFRVLLPLREEAAIEPTASEDRRAARPEDRSERGGEPE